MKYMRKTPVEAIQWTGTNRKEVQDFIINAANSCCTQDDGFGRLIIVFENLREQAIKTVLPKFGWVVREGKTFQFYRDLTFRKTFEEVQEDGNKGVDWEGMNKTIKEAFDSFDEVFKDFNDVFGAEPSKKESGVLSTMVRLNNEGRMAKLIDDFYKDDEKTREKVKKQLSEGLKEMTGSDTHKATFESVLVEMKELHAKKNKDYNESFHNLFKEYGMPYALCHIEEKLNRVKAIIANGGNAVTNEHVEDSLIDGACYNILTLIELRNRKH